MMATIVATPVNQSWAQAAVGDSQVAECTPKSIKPGARGSLLRFCRGKVITMLSHYGWLMLHGEVDHPAVEKHGGDVYIHKDDVCEGEAPVSGDTVTFYLYADDKGLGAEQCCVAQRASSSYNPNVPANTVSEQAMCNPNLVDEVADVFLRMSLLFASADEESDDDELDLDKPKVGDDLVHVDEVAGVFLRMSLLFASANEESDDDELDFDKPKVGDDLVLVDEVADVFLRMSLLFASAGEESDDHDLDFDKPRLGEQAESCDGFTSGGGTSDSESETFSETTSDSEAETFSIQGEPLVTPLADLFLRMSLVFASADEDSDDDDLDSYKPGYVKWAPSCSSSTSGGGTSDSEQETFSESTSDSEEETFIQEGLMVAPNFRL